MVNLCYTSNKFVSKTYIENFLFITVNLILGWTYFSRLTFIQIWLINISRVMQGIILIVLPKFNSRKNLGTDMYNRCSLFYIKNWMNCRVVRVVFRILSNIYDGVMELLANSSRLNCFAQTLFDRVLNMSPISYWNWCSSSMRTLIVGHTISFRRRFLIQGVSNNLLGHFSTTTCKCVSFKLQKHTMYHQFLCCFSANLQISWRTM